MTKLVRKGRYKPPHRYLRRTEAEVTAEPKAFDTAEGKHRYRDWLVQHLGRPMERALVRAEQRYQKLKPAQIRATALHTAYRRKKR